MSFIIHLFDFGFCSGVIQKVDYFVCCFAKGFTLKTFDVFHPLLLPLFVLATTHQLLGKKIPISTLLHFAKSKNKYSIQTKKSTDRKKVSGSHLLGTLLQGFFLQEGGGGGAMPQPQLEQGTGAPAEYR